MTTQSKRTRTAFTFVLLFTAAACASACGDPADDASDESGSDADESLEIAGEYTDTWGSEHTIGVDLWTITSPSSTDWFHIESFDNEARFAIAQNDADNGYSPELWSRFDWTWSGETLYYCQSTYDAETADAAEASGLADPADLDAGCGADGFGWTMMTP